MKNRYLHVAKVVGRIRENKMHFFPEDMLRYDQCVPLNFKLERDEEVGATVATKFNEEDEHFLVAQMSPRMFPRWTEGRWSSFLFGIAHLHTVTLDPK